MQRLGEKLHTLRKRRGLTQTELAELIGLDHSHIGRIERGERLPSLEILAKLMEIFNVSCDQLMKDDRELD
ncbi:MAG: XRE family transcriptional regulator [Caldilinea sp. CFX5]|nr:XRE family transcriptional regulator [Caldilinea sp. CFX5]